MGRLVFCRPSTPYEATLWVNASTGDDSRSKATVAASGGSLPWATIGRAVWGNASRSSPNSGEAAAADDVVSIAAGTYSDNTLVSSKQTPLYNPTNEGTSGHPIIFLAAGAVVLGAPAANSPVIGSDGRDYIRWYAAGGGSYFSITCDGRVAVDEIDADDTKGVSTVVNTKPDTGPVVIWDCVGSEVEGCIIDGGPSINYTDNWNGIRVENGTAFVIRNNQISNFTRSVSGGTNHNQSCITIYGGADGLVEHNALSNAGAGVYFKDTGTTNPQSGNVVRYNLVDGCLQAFAWSVTGQDRNYVYQNLVTDCELGLEFTGASPCNDWVYNNTFYNLSQGGLYLSNTSGTGGKVWNNIFSVSPYGIFLNGFTMPADTVLQFQHNVWHSITNTYSGSDGNQSLAAFKSANPNQEQAAPAGTSSDPLFTSSGTDFTLQAGSPARNLGVHPGTAESNHAGCYQTGTEVMGTTS